MSANVYVVVKSKKEALFVMCPSNFKGKLEELNFWGATLSKGDIPVLRAWRVGADDKDEKKVLDRMIELLEKGLEYSIEYEY